MKILWLASWYPSRLEPFNGDFVQRHAEAAGLYHDVEVIHVIKDASGAVTKNLRVEHKQAGRVIEQTIYYHRAFHKIPILGRLFSHWQYQQVFKKQIEKYLQENGRPDLVHVHVCLKAGLLALWMKRKYGLPYAVTEHSTIFLPEAKTNIFKSPFYLRKLCRTILKNASGLSVVSEHLGKAIRKFAKGRTYSVIPNTVNTSVFQPVTKTNNALFELIHISNLSPQKNFDKIIEALCLLKARRTGFVLRVFGSDGEAWPQKVIDAGLTGYVFFYGEVPQPQLANHLQKADALILFSGYETFGCVLIEAAVCGVPVIVNNIPPMREIVDDGFTGLVLENNAAALADGLEQMLDKQLPFNKSAVAQQAKERFDYETIGRAFSSFYEEVLRTNKPKNQS